MRNFWTLRNSLVQELDVCAVVIYWAKEVEQQPWWWWWWHHSEAMPRQTHLRAHIVSHNPLPHFQGFTVASWSLQSEGWNPYFTCFSLQKLIFFPPPHIEHRWYHALICWSLFQHRIFQPVFKSLQAWPDIIMGSTPESDVVVLPLWEVTAFASLDTAVWLCCVKRTHCHCESWLNHKLCVRRGITVYVDEFAWVVTSLCVSFVSSLLLSSKVRFMKRRGSVGGGGGRGGGQLDQSRIVP